MSDVRTKTEDVVGTRRYVLLVTFGAVALRLALFLGRGDYLAFDEGWYLLLGRNLWSGGGYTLSGLRHVALSPLFPVLTGGLGRVVGDPVWAGRIIAAVSSGLLVVPCWYIFRRLAGPRTARLGILLVAVLPSLAPFVVPYWIGWDLWVGAEPLLHLFLYSGVALFLRAWEDRRLASALGCGAAFSFAYLARPEAAGTFGVLGLLAVLFGAFVSRAGRLNPARHFRLAMQVAACAVTFVLLASPYWVYLHDSLGRWTITGRGVQLVPQSMTPRMARGRAAPNRIETMLWDGDSSPYIQRLYALDPSGTELANNYWGVEVERHPEAVQGGSQGDVSAPDADGPRSAPVLSHQTGASGLPPGNRGENPALGPPSGSSDDGARGPPSPWLLRYARALGVVVPWYLWLFVLPGLVGPARDRRRDLEALVGIPLVVTSVLIARVVAIDPRTQLFIAPLAAFYAARGVLVASDFLAKRLEGRVRGSMVPRVLVGALAVVLLGTSVGRLVLSLTVGSPHHVVAAENAAVGEAIRRATPEDATVMSFHPAVALFADRDWRVLPLEPMDRIVRYARTQPRPYLVLSVFYPPEVRPLEEPHYLIVPVGGDLPQRDRWRIHVPQRARVYAFGQLVPMN